MNTVGRYGPRVVGQAQFEREREAIKKNTIRYGPRVTGVSQAAPKTEAKPPASEGTEAAAEAATDARVAELEQALRSAIEEIGHLRAQLEATRTEPESAPAVVEQPGLESAPAATPEQETPDIQKATEEAAGADGYLSVNELAVAVQENPALIDGFLERELAREPRPRIGALRALLAVEQARRDQPARPNVVDRINARLAELTG